MKNKNKLNTAVYGLRLELGLNQTTFAEKMGVTAMSVSRWEAGQNEPPADCIIRMAKLAGGQSFWYFLGQVGLSKKDFAKRL